MEADCGQVLAAGQGLIFIPNFVHSTPGILWSHGSPMYLSGLYEQVAHRLVSVSFAPRGSYLDFSNVKNGVIHLSIYDSMAVTDFSASLLPTAKILDPSTGIYLSTAASVIFHTACSVLLGSLVTY